MPIVYENEGDRPIPIKIPQRIILEAGAAGCASVPEYINFLKDAIAKKDAQYNALKASLNNTDQDTEKVKKLLNATSDDKV